MQLAEGLPVEAVYRRRKVQMGIILVCIRVGKRCVGERVRGGV